MSLISRSPPASHAACGGALGRALLAKIFAVLAAAVTTARTFSRPPQRTQAITSTPNALNGIASLNGLSRRACASLGHACTCRGRACAGPGHVCACSGHTRACSAMPAHALTMPASRPSRRGPVARPRFTHDEVPLLRRRAHSAASGALAKNEAYHRRTRMMGPSPSTRTGLSRHTLCFQMATSWR